MTEHQHISNLEPIVEGRWLDVVEIVWSNMVYAKAALLIEEDGVQRCIVRANEESRDAMPSGFLQKFAHERFSIALAP